MATRFYTVSTAATPAISPAFDAGWEQTGSVTRMMMYPSRTWVFPKSASATTITRTVPITTTQDILASQFISEGFPRSIFLEGTVQFRHFVFESATTANVTMAAVIKIVSSDGGTIRGTLFSNFNTGGAEFALGAAPAARGINATAFTGFQCFAGDCLVYEIGGHAAAPTAATTYTMQFNNFTTGAPDGRWIDLASISTATVGNGFLEVSQNIWSDDFNNFMTPTSSGLSVTG